MRITEDRSGDPTPGFFLLSKVKGASPVPARIHWACRCHANGTKWGFLHDHADGCDRSPFLQAEVDGVAWDMEKVWMFGERITEQRFRYLTDLLAWLRYYKPTDARCCTERPLNMSKVDFIDG